MYVFNVANLCQSFIWK